MLKVTKKDIIESFAEKFGYPFTKSEEMIDFFLNEIVRHVVNGEAVVLSSFGMFLAKKRNERIGVNPRTKERLTVPATVTPKFRAGKGFKDKVKTQS